MATKKWTAVEYDVARMMKSSIGSKLKLIELPKTLQMQVVIELDDALYLPLSKNPTWLQKMQSAASAKSRSAIDKLEKFILDSEAKAAKFDRKAAQAFSRDVETQLEKQAQAISDEMADACAKVIADYQKGQAELTKFRVKSGGKIAMSALKIVGEVTASVLTAGGFSPVGILGIVRDGLAIGQEIVKLALSADQLAKLIQAEFKILKKAFDEKGAQNSQKSSGAKEVALNVIARLSGVEITSLKNVKSRIELHKIDIAKIEKESKKLSEKIYAAMDAQEKQQKIFDNAKKSLPAKRVGQIKLELEKVEKALDKLLNATIAVNQSVEAAEARQENFEKAIEAMTSGMPGWAKYADIVIGNAINLAIDLTEASNTMDAAEEIIKASIETMDEIREEAEG
jgi:hypothetical protein